MLFVKQATLLRDLLVALTFCPLVSSIIMSDSDSDTEQGVAKPAASSSSSSVAAAAGGPAAVVSPELAAQRAARKEAKAAAKAAKKAARPPPEVHLKNVPMLLVTCDGGKEALAKKEILSWMSEYADRVYPRQIESAAKGATSVSSGLAAELAALQAESRAERASATASSAAAAAGLGVRFKLVGDMVIYRGLILVAVLDPAINIVEMVYGMMQEVRETKVFKTRSIPIYRYDWCSCLGLVPEPSCQVPAQ